MKKESPETTTLKKLMLIVIAAPFVIFLVYHGRQNTQQVTMAQREAIEAQAEAQDARMDAVAATHKVRIGMTAVQCRAAWGEPRSINRTITAHGVSEQWVYSGGYLYLDDGILRTIQN